jgi:hypothetical protein
MVITGNTIEMRTFNCHDDSRSLRFLKALPALCQSSDRWALVRLTVRTVKRSTLRHAARRLENSRLERVGAGSSQ